MSAYVCHTVSQQTPKFTGFSWQWKPDSKTGMLSILFVIFTKMQKMWLYTFTGASLDYPPPNLQVIWYPATSSFLTLPLRKRQGSAILLPCDQPRCSAGSSACEPAPPNLSRSSSPSPWRPRTPWRSGTRTPRCPRSRPTASLGASPWAKRSKSVV